ncbi:MAG: N-6 DNA methylase [Pyrinomonadaceae bacterium]
MSLFQNAVLKKYLAALDRKQINAAWEKFTAHFHDPDIQENIRNATEVQYQDGFLSDLFVDVLGYTKNPAPGFDLTSELKNVKGSKTADGAILKDDEAIAVIELKGTNTIDLAKVEAQGFGYKNNHPKCTYVITSNFEKLRFYIENAVEFEEFDLFNLSRERFDMLWLCLHSENLLRNTPKRIKDESLTEGEIITKKLYKDYSAFRNDIYADISENNPEYDKLILFKKTQKLLDRFLFILFAEDKQLLPPNSIGVILKDWRDLQEKYDEYFPLYDRFKKYFGYLNTGFKGKKHDVFAYNGGLFLPDEILDNIRIDDELLSKHIKTLSNYDFASEVSVNILGHIFEHSLTEIESIQAELAGEEIDKSKTKRKKDGVFYTPKYITKYIVDNTIGRLCEEKKQELEILDENYEQQKGRHQKTIDSLREKLDIYRSWLLALTICDPACGSGAFLNQALEFLIAEHRYIDELYQKLEGFSLPLTDIENSILENNLFGVDINEESIEIAKLSLWLRTAQKGRKLTSLNDNIKCGNSLIEDPEVAGEKAFDWKQEFPKVFANGGFDVVIGNPPWGARMNASEMRNIKHNHREIIVRMVDSFMFFTNKAINLTNGSGSLGLIIPDVILYQKDNEKLRRKILRTTTLTHALNVGDRIFESVARPSAIIIANKIQGNKITKVGNFDSRYDRDLFSIHLEKVPQELFYSLPNTIFATREIEGYSLFTRLSGKRLQDVLDDDGIQRGISPDLKEAFIVDSHTIIDRKLEEENIRRTVTGGVDVKRFNILDNDKSILYVSKTTNATIIPNIVSYISDFKNRITCKEVSQGKHPFYSLHRTRSESIFAKHEKIIGVITGDTIITAVDDEKIYPTDGLYVFSANPKMITNKALSTILNSKFITYTYRLISSETNRTMAQVKPVMVAQLPIVIPDRIEIDELEAMYEAESQGVVSLNNLGRTLTDFLRTSLEIEFSKKLQNWHELEFAEFIKELTKAVKKTGRKQLTKSDEMEWMELFETKKKEAQALKKEIDETDRKIDQMVYQLYGLTDEEIAIVESSIS